ncbi:MHC class II transactivator [Carlito syrichta]|uniref:MHC class II transactivator n=1 Tax=Carlito syrichta TaxID=1868482 RepID=A0A3Q0E503_CARSF|nr:MHC class II transactivator [Carlito syrichta]
MELGPPEGGYLELLNSDADPLRLYHFYDQMDLAGEEEITLSSPEPDTDTINCDQFSRLLCDIDGDEETREAYANIAELDQYVFQDSQLEGPSKDIFIEHIGSDEVTGESVEVLGEVGQKSQKRPFPEELPTGLKHPKLAELPAGPMVTGTFLAGPAGDCSSLPCPPLPALLTSQTLPEETDPTPRSPSSASGGCLNLPAGSIHFIPTLRTLPQGLWQISGPGTGVSSIVIYQGEMPQASPAPPSSGPTVHGLPTSPGRPGSTSPFAPSAADLPSMPEPALTYRADTTEGEMSPTHCQAAGEVSNKQLKWPVLGRPGQGKSCWARAVSRAWACGQLPQYDFVFCVPCGCLDRPGDGYRLQDLLLSLGPEPLEVDDEVFGHILRRPDRVLLVLDAFEDLEAQDGLLHNASSPAAPEPCSLRALLAGLFQRRLLRGCTLLLTARPRGRLAPSLSKADTLFEVTGFSDEQARAYVARYFECRGTAEHHQRALALLQDQPFLLSHAHSPTVCRAVCQLSEALGDLGDEAEPPTTLTGLFVGLLGPAAHDGPPGALVGLAELAWQLGRRHQGTLREDQLPEEVRTWAVARGLVQPAPGAPGTRLTFSSFLLQCFLGAMWLALSSEVKSKELPRYLALTPRKKRPYDNWLEGVPRFLAGLVFQPRARCLGALVGPAVAAVVDKKQKVLARYLRRLQPGMLCAGRLLELLHCAHEAQEAVVWCHVVQELPACLSFLGTRLTPPDSHVLARALEAAGRDFFLDLRSTGIDPSGLGSLVGLRCVTRFRAALSDTVRLWESLRRRGETKLLQAAEEKFTIEPFKAKSLKDVEDLDSLVQTQRTRRSLEDTAEDLPAVRDLKKLEFALGPTAGPQAFPTLVRILAAFSSLQHLDLDSLSENKIGDDGACAGPALRPPCPPLCLCSLSQNSITDVGARTLAEALPSLAASLLRLSLYNNCICDGGAGSLARVLPDMVSLRVLDVQYNKFTAAGAQQLAASLKKCPHVETLAMWTPTIPFGVQEHLQQLDSRISLR